jgi:hypothetical protein
MKKFSAATFLHTKDSLLFNFSFLNSIESLEELGGRAVSMLRPAIAEDKQRWSIIGWVTKKFIIPRSYGLRKAR